MADSAALADAPAPAATGDAADPVLETQRKLEAMIAALEAERSGAIKPPPADDDARGALAELRRSLTEPAAATAPETESPRFEDPPAFAELAAFEGTTAEFPALSGDPFADDRTGAASPDGDDDAAPVRSALAEMFELDPAEIAARAAPRPEPERAAEGLPAAQPEPEPTAEIDEEPVAEAAPEPVAESNAEVAAEPASSEPDAADGAGVRSDEVTDYMADLLARMRQTQGDPAPPPEPAAKKPGPKPPAAAAPDARSDAAAPPAAAAAAPIAGAGPAGSIPAALPRPAAMPRPKVDKEQLREEMRKLRAIANSSARSAVMESTWKRTRARLVCEVVMCSVALGLGLTLLLTSVWGVAVHWVAGGAVCCGAVWIARDFGRSLETLRQQKAAARLAAKEEAARTGVPPKTGPRALDVPAAHDGAAD